MEMTYLDNSATTPVCREAAEKALEMMTACFGNPSSLHTLGIQAERELEAARAAVASLIGAPPETVVFTSGGTEANNLAVLGGAAARARQGKHAVTTAVEHPSVAAAFDVLENRGYAVERLHPDGQGRITADDVAAACRPDTVLVSIMLVNNETGARFPIEEIVPAVRRAAPGALIHCDAVQAAGKIPLHVLRMGVDLLSVSGHKIHAPKGVGALYIRKGARVLSRAVGGGQEKGRRAGTEAMPAIAAFGAAAAALPAPPDQAAHFCGLRERLLSGLQGRDDVVLHLPADGVPYIVNLSVPGVRSETMLHYLAQRQVYVSSGSACSKGKKSPVLTALGLPAAEIDSALRISFSHTNGEGDVDRFLRALDDGIAALKRGRG